MVTLSLSHTAIPFTKSNSLILANHTSNIQNIDLSNDPSSSPRVNSNFTPTIKPSDLPPSSLPSIISSDKHPQIQVHYFCILTLISSRILTITAS